MKAEKTLLPENTAKLLELAKQVKRHKRDIQALCRIGRDIDGSSRGDQSSSASSACQVLIKYLGEEADAKIWYIMNQLNVTHDELEVLRHLWS